MMISISINFRWMSACLSNFVFYLREFLSEFDWFSDIDKDTIVDVLHRCENYVDSLVSIDSTGLLVGFISNNSLEERNNREFLFLNDCRTQLANNDNMKLVKQDKCKKIY